MKHPFSSRRRPRVFTALLAALMLLTTLAPAAVWAQSAPGDVEYNPLTVEAGGAPEPGSGPIDITGFARAIDGNTFEVWLNNNRVGIGVIGIDVPQGNTLCGIEATNYLQGMAFGGLHLEEDAELIFGANDRRMYYMTTPDGMSLAAAMVSAGMATANGEGAEAQALAALQAEAEAEGRGCLWGGPVFGPQALPQSDAERGLDQFEWRLPPGFALDVVTSNLDFPTTFAFLPDGRILIAEKSGVIRVFKDGQLLAEPFIDLSSEVNDYWDRGLIGLAVDPSFAANGYVYIAYTYEHDPVNYSGTKTARVIRVTAVGDVAQAGSALIILGTLVGDSCNNFPVNSDCMPSDGPGHSVGDLVFASDGSLFVTLGDAASFNSVNSNALRAQDLDSLAGKVLRVTTTGQGVAGNPFFTGNASDNRSKVYAYGVRNAFRFTQRPDNGMLYVGDVGWNTWEELNVTSAGANLGWPCYEGMAQQGGYDNFPVCEQLYLDATAVSPLVTWLHDGFSTSATGGVFYTGTEYPAEYHGAYFYGDYGQSFVRTLTVDGSDQLLADPLDFLDEAEGPVKFVSGPNGDIYYLAINSGQIRRFHYTGELPSDEIYISDLAFSFEDNHWGPVERDQSNGEDDPGDGGPLTINGVVYPRGLGVHANSDVRVVLDGACQLFTTTIGIDDEVGSNGSVVFEVWGDGVLLHQSATLTGASAAVPLSLDISGVVELRLVVDNVGATGFDHADWADAKVTCATDEVAPEVETMTPQDGAVDVAVNAALEAGLSEQLDETSLDGAVSLVRQSDGQPVAATVSFDSATNVLTVTPDADLEISTLYQLTILGGVDGVTDLAGNPLAADFVTSFTTAAVGAPVATITSPVDGTLFQVGQLVDFAGTAVDGNGNPLPADAFDWKIRIQHCEPQDCHVHQLLNLADVTSGSFIVPDHGGDYYFDIILEVTDQFGFTDSQMVSILPQTVNVTLATDPAGLDISMSGDTAAAPMTRAVVVGSTISISVASPQGAYEFESWSDGGAQLHDVVVGTSDVTYTAGFTTGSGGGALYLSDLEWTSSTNGWGPVERDQSNAEKPAGDGGQLTINGVTYAKGIGTHANSSIELAIPATCTTFAAEVGIDDEISTSRAATVRFEVWGGTTRLYQSVIMTPSDAALPVLVDVTGHSTLRLVVDRVENNGYDHADWGDAKFLCADVSDTTPPSVDGVSPLDGATSVALDVTPSATFSEPLDTASVTGNAVLRESVSGTAVPGTVSYDDTTRTITVTPDSALSYETIYEVELTGGTGGIADVAGNVLASNYSWSFTTTVDPATAPELYISDLPWISSTNGWGPVERDQSNAEKPAGDGDTLTINGVTYAKGLGTHANSSVEVAIPATCSIFTAHVGIDDEISTSRAATVRFEVWGGTTRLYQSVIMTPSDAALPVSVDLTGHSTLRLVVDRVENNGYDHADWGDAKLLCGDQTDTTPPNVISVNPVDGATGVDSAVTPSATFSEPLDAASVTGNAVLRESVSGTVVPGTVSYDDATRRITVTPDAEPAFETTYEVELTGGTGGIADVAGNVLASNHSWSFTTMQDPATSPELYISDLPWISSTNGWGPVERDLSNGEKPVGDGDPLSINGVTYAKGLGAHANSSVEVAIPATCSIFAAEIGIDDEVPNGSAASVQFEVWGGTTRLYQSPVLGPTAAPLPVSVDLTGHSTVRLVIDDGTTNLYDHADWGDAKFLCGDQTDTTPPSVTGVDPAAGALGVALDVVPSASFSEPLDPASVTGNAVLRVDATDAPVAATVTYDDATRRISITPDVELEVATVYEVVLTGGTGGISDVAGNLLASDYSWTFTTNAAGLVFSTPQSFAAGVNAHSAITGDLDGDQNLDVVATNSANDTLSVFMGDGQGSFATAVSYPAGDKPKYAMLADLNEDGDLDIVAGNEDTDDLNVLLGNGDGTFATKVDYLACDRPHHMMAADLNGDDNLDIVAVCLNSPNNVVVLLGNGDGTLQAATPINTGGSPHSVALADYNEDGALDVAVADLNTDRVNVLLGNGDGTFQAAVNYTVGDRPHSIAMADLDKDGSADLVTANDNSANVSVLFGNGDGTFQTHVTHAVGSVPKTVVVGDLNGDSWLDIVTSNTHGNYPNGSAPTDVSVLLSDGAGGFLPASPYPTGLTPFGLALGDFNEDGLLDIVTANWHSNDLTLLLQEPS